MSEYVDKGIIKMKRLAIFVFYDRDGIVDRYVIYLLEQLKKCVADLAIIVNGKIGSDGRMQLEELSDWLFIRENKGFDAMAFKLAMTDYLGWDKITQYDEVLLANDTFYGPFYPLQDIFESMAQREVDFWGMSCQQESTDYFSYNQKIIPAYIQSFFLVFRNPVLCSRQFQEYWNQFDSTKWIFSDVTNLHEKVFTNKLEAMGFVWDTYIKEPYFESKHPEQNFIQYYYISYQLIKNRKCPIIKRKSFIMKHLTESHGGTGEDIVRALHYIEENTGYDTDMIWDNLLRLYDISDIHKTLNLNYILPKINQNALEPNCPKAAVIVCLTSICCLNESIEYLRRISLAADVYLLSDSKDILNEVQRQTETSHICAELIQDIAEEKLHSIFMKKTAEVADHYDYLLYLYDIDYVHASDSRLQEYSEYHNIWSNLAADDKYISEVCRLFEQNPRLGLLNAPPILSGTEFGTLDDKWNGTRDAVKQCLIEMQISKTISENTECLNVCHAFWCRTKILKVYISYFIKCCYNTETVSRCYPYLAQTAGYYTGTVMNSESASVMYTNMQELLKCILKHTRTKYDFTDFDSYLDGDVLIYCKKFERIMVYGAGENGYRTACLLKKHNICFAGYIVSDGQPCEKQKYGEPLITVSQLPEKSDALGIVVSVANPRFQAEIAECLHNQGYWDIYIL